MLQQPIISVIIPCYNDGKYLGEAVDSVVNSTYKNIEIIIVNDGSTDNTKNVGEQLQKKYNNVIYIEQENKGLPVTRNNGISIAKGQYILPLDADDRIAPNYIEKSLHLFENDIDKKIKLIYCNARFFYKKKGLWRLKKFSLKNIAKENMIFCSAIYRKEDWKKIGGYSEEMLEGWEDWDFWISLLKNGGKVIQLPIIGFFYRIKENSMRKSMTKKLKKEKIKFLNKKHHKFFVEQLNGPLRNSRSLSKTINFFSNLFSRTKSYFAFLY